MPFVDEAGKPGTEEPAQIVSAVPKLNNGVILGVTVIVSVVAEAHCPAAGVNVYVAEC